MKSLIVYYLGITLAMCFLGWIVISWFQVIGNNLAPGAVYPEWNFFKVICSIGQMK